MEQLTVRNWAETEKDVTILVEMNTPFNVNSTLLYADCKIENADKFNKFLSNLVKDYGDLNTELDEDYTLTNFLDDFSTYDIMDAIEQTGDIGVHVIKYY